MSQKESLLQWLKRGDSITALQALAHLRIMRLAARIEEIRREGYPVRTDMIETASGKHVANYSLESLT